MILTRRNIASTTVHRSRLRNYLGPHPQSWLKVSAPAEHELPVEQQPKIKEVIQRQPDCRVMSDDVEQILGKGTLEQSSLRRSKGKDDLAPDRLGLMNTNKNS